MFPLRQSDGMLNDTFGLGMMEIRVCELITAGCSHCHIIN